jgi:hypothetical protein
MVDVFVRELLGNWGSTLLDTYLKYSLYINSIIFIYVVTVILSRRNYHQILNSLVKDLKIKYQNQFKNKDKRQIAAVLNEHGVPWEQGLNASKFPLLTHPRGILVYPKSTRTLQRLFSIEHLAEALKQGQKKT